MTSSDGARAIPRSSAAIWSALETGKLPPRSDAFLHQTGLAEAYGGLPPLPFFCGPCHERDYEALGPAMGAIVRGLIVIGRKGVAGHTHRWWEYGTMLAALAWHFSGRFAGRRMLEIGPGDASPLAPALSLLGAEVTVLEREPQFAAEVAAQSLLVQAFGGTPIEVKVGDAAERFDCDQPFDAVVSVSVLEHIDDDAGAMAIAGSYLKPAGLLALTFDLAATPGAVGHASERLYQPSDLTERILPALKTVGCAPVVPALYDDRTMNVLHYTFGALVCRR